MKYEGYITGSEYDWAKITDEDIANYPKKYTMETMYAREGDITFIWAAELLCLPNAEVELNRQIINFMAGEIDDDGSRKYAQRCFEEFVNHNIIETKQNLLFEVND